MKSKRRRIVAALALTLVAIVAVVGVGSTGSTRRDERGAASTQASLVPPATETNGAAPQLAFTDSPSPGTVTTGAPAPCTAGYDPCIPPSGGDVDCRGTGDGPRFVTGPVRVDHRFGDPYGLDPDGDGIACP